MSSTKRGTGYVFVPAGRPWWYARFYAKGRRYLLNTQVRADEPKAKAEARADQDGEGSGGAELHRAERPSG